MPNPVREPDDGNQQGANAQQRDGPGTRPGPKSLTRRGGHQPGAKRQRRHAPESRRNRPERTVDGELSLARRAVGRDWGDGGILGLRKGGPSTGRKDFVCQSCGFRFTVGPTRGRLVGGGLFALMFLGFGCAGVCGGLIAGLSEGNFDGLVLAPIGFAIGLPVLWWTTALWRADRRHPIVPDAAMPPIRYSLSEPSRRCTCGETARCTHVLQWRKAGVNLGQEMTYTSDGAALVPTALYISARSASVVAPSRISRICEAAVTGAVPSADPSAAASSDCTFINVGIVCPEQAWR